NRDRNRDRNMQAAEHPMAAEFRSRMEAWVAGEIRVIDTRASLTVAQKKKLQLAARGDLADHLSRAAELRPKLTSKPLAEQQYLELMREVQPLRLAQQFGIFGANSLFRKILRRMLTADQLRMVERERQKQIIESALLNCEQAKSRFVLTGETRRKFAELILEHGQVPQYVGPYGEPI